MGRRHFLKLTALAAGAMYIDLPSFAEQVKIFGKPNLRMGVLSDIHVCDDESEEALRHALEYFRSCKVDGVIVAGDMADHGLAYELYRVSRAWYTVFPKDKLPDGVHVEKVFVYGNHDTFNEVHSDWFKELPAGQQKYGTVRENYRGNWKKYFKEDYAQVYMKDVKGYKWVARTF